MDNLNDLVNCSHMISSDKATERKKQVEVFRSLLEQTKYINALDRNSGSKKGCTWEKIFHAVENHITKEAQYFQKETKKQKGPSTRARPAQYSSNLFKFVVRKANGRGPKLKCSIILDHLISCLDHSFTCSLFGLDYCSVLLKDILSDHRMWCDVLPNNWQDLTRLMCVKYQGNVEGLDRVMLLQILERIISIGSTKTTLQVKSLFPFFANSSENMKNEKSSTHIEAFMSALVAFGVSVAPDHRFQLCQFGENVFPLIMNWWNSKPTESVKQLLVSFLDLQMVVHHPRGAGSEAEGALACDQDLWRSHLRRMYITFKSDLTQKNKYSSSKATQPSVPFLQLMVRVCRQITFLPFEDVLSHEERLSDSPGCAAKRRKSQGPVQDIEEAIFLSLKDGDCVWLQLLAIWLNCFSDTLSAATLNSFLVKLHRLLVDCKRSTIIKHLLELGSAYVGCHLQLQKVNSLKEADLSPAKITWKLIYERILKVFSMNQAKDQCLALIKLLVMNKLVKPEPELWWLFGTRQVLSRGILEVLAMYIQHNELPKAKPPELLPFDVPEDSSSDGSCSFRLYLMNHLLQPVCDDDGTRQFNITSETVEILAEILVALCLRTPFNFQSVQQSKSHRLSNSEYLETLETLYLNSTFDLPIVRCDKSLQRSDVKRSQKDVNHIPAMAKQLMNIILGVGTDLLENGTKTEVQYLVGIANYCCLVVLVTHSLLDIEVLTETGVANHRLCNQTKMLFVTLVESCGKLSNTESLQQIVESLLPISCIVQHVADNVVKTLIPNQLFKLLFTTFKNNICGMNTAGTSQARMNDDPFENATSSNFNDEFDDENGFSEDSFNRSQFIVKTCENVLDSSVLTTSEVTCQRVARFLCCLNYLDDIDIEMDGTAFDMRCKLLEVFREDDFDVTISSNLQLVLDVVHHIFLNNSNVNDNVIELASAVLRKVSKSYCKYPQVVTRIVGLIGSMTPHLARSGASFRNNILSVLHAFWIIYTKGKLGPQPSLEIVKCVTAFAEVDYANIWAVLPEKGSDTTTETTPLITLLDSKYFFVQLESSLAIFHLVKCDPLTCLLDSEIVNTHNEILQKVIGLRQSINCEQASSSSVEESNDTMKKKSVFILALSGLAHGSPYCEKAALFSLVESVAFNGVSIASATKAISRISKFLGYEDFQRYMELHLEFLIHDWVMAKHSIVKFPFNLLNCNSLDNFIRKHYKTLIPWLVVAKSKDAVEYIAGKLDLDMVSLLSECFSRIIVKLLPVIATKHNVAADDYRNASAVLQQLEVLLSKQRYQELLEEQFSDIVVQLFCLLQDKHDSSKILPPANPPTFARQEILMSLECLKNQCARFNEKSIVASLIEDNSIQSVLLSLKVNLVTAHRTHQQFRALHIYKLFVEQLLTEFDSLGVLTQFVLQDIVYTLVHVLTDSCCGGETDIIGVVINLLFIMSEKVLNHDQNQLGKILCFMVHSLLTVMKNGFLKSEILRLLEFLLIDNADKLSVFIQSLDSFPETAEMARISEVYRNLKYRAGELSLREEMCCFLKNCEASIENTASRLEGLRFLKEQLAKRKEELKDLFSELAEQRGFSELCGNSVIHRLIAELIHLSSNANLEVSLAAARCLGEIGPANLSTLVIQIDHLPTRYKHALEAFENDSLAQRNTVILKLLAENLFRKDTQLVKAASSVLKSILTTAAGKKFFSEYKRKGCDDLAHFLHPFRNMSLFETGVQPKPEPEVIMDILDQNDLWRPTNVDHVTWLTNLICSLIDSHATSDEILQCLVPMAKLQIDFCQRIFPFLIHAILKENGGQVRDVISQQVRSFFEKCCDLKSTEIESTTIFCNKRSVKTLLSMMNYLRLQDRNLKNKTADWNKNFWLDVNYLHIAQAAQYCGADFSALMFLEIWYSSKEVELPTLNADSLNEQYLRTYVATAALGYEEETNVAYELILNAYRSIGDPDGCYGFHVGHFNSPSLKIHQYERETHWNKALATYSFDVETNPSSQMGVVKSMQMLGLNNILDTYLNGLDPCHKNTPELQEFQFECMWRNCQWKLPRPRATEERFNQSVYNAVTDLIQHEDDRFSSDISSAYAAVTKNLASVSLESTHSVYLALTRFQTLVQLEDFKSAKHSMDEQNINLVLRKWELQDRFNQSNFLFAEPVIAMQTTVLQLDPESPMCCEGLGERLLLKAKLARKAGYLDMAAAVVAQVRLLKNLNQKQEWQRELEESRIFWEREERATAIQKMQNLLQVFDNDPLNSASAMHSEALGLISRWLIETKSEIPHAIMQHLNQAVDVGTQTNSNSDLIDAYLAIGRFADSHYQRITTHMKSAEFESKLDYICKSKVEAQQLRTEITGPSNSNKDQIRAIVSMEKQSRLDEQEVNNMKEDQKLFLKQALNFYFACLKAGDDHNLRIFRLVSLWFQNQQSEEVNKQVSTGMKHISTYKFLPLMHQLAARMSVDNTPFQKTLVEIIEKATADHPHHTLLTILALCNAYKGEVTTSVLKKNQIEEEDRVLAAKNVIARLRRKKHLVSHIGKLERLCDAYITFSNYFGKEKKLFANIPMPAKTSLLKLGDLSGVAIATDETPVNIDAKYDVPYIVSFDSYYKLCGGINVPKVLSCVGSDGKKRIQLLKGQDDLHQDAVMQQVFEIVNSLLRQNSETRKRNLLIRTYKVVPLSQRSGVVQWCNGTMPFGEYVVNAHARYNPKEYSAAQCRELMVKVVQNKPEKKLQTFQEICCKFHPVFRYFFFENFPEPVVWFERQLAYTKSVATSSIVGYILGLGDRHVANILIDKTTAEVIHIDLGVSFDQGKLLPIPETVPFRLTRDVVNGMGITGVEGVFRRSCEKTMEILRHSQETVLTLLEVLLYDPLYAWTTSLRKARTQQEAPQTSNSFARSGTTAAEESESKHNNVNKQAEHVLLRLQQKLQGMEEGVVLSVSGQVNYLIKEASDPKNLCRVFAGWQPYL